MKKLILALAVSFGMMACGNSSQKQTADQQTAEATATTTAVPLDSMLTNAENYLDKEVTFKGYVTHTCKHAGKRCFMQGDNKNISVRVEAKGEIGGFNRELIGNEIAVTGTLKEKRLSDAEINSMEKAIETKSLQDDGSQETCDAERANIKEMRTWMKSNNKDYFAIYYVDGIKYNQL